MSNTSLIFSQQLPWLPPHTIKRRKGARHVRFTVDGKGYLSITTPMKLSTYHLLKAITQQRAWIEKHSSFDTPIDYNNYYPLYLSLHAFKEHWSIRYIPTHHKRLSLTIKEQQIILRGPIHEIALCQLQLRQWIRQRAMVLLNHELNKISQAIGLTYNKLTLRTQKSRWGSCNTKKNITLNDKLLFLPYHWVRYVCIHELCHTKHMNHSQQFWQLVAHYDPNYKQHKYMLSKAERYIPGWL